MVSRVTSYLWPATEKPYYPFLSKLSDTGRPVNELVANVISLAVGSSVNYAQGGSWIYWVWFFILIRPLAAVNVIDFYLDDERAPERAKIINLVKAGDNKSTELLRGYVREAMSGFINTGTSQSQHYSHSSQGSIHNFLASTEMPL